jgi:hypothetical protein
MVQMTKAPNDVQPTRPWRRLHGSAYVVLLLAAAVLFLLNVPGQYTVHVDMSEREPFERLRHLGIGFERIEHGWPWSWLVRDETHDHIDPATNERRFTKIWSFSEDFHSFSGWALFGNILAACLVLAVVTVSFEYWRRQRYHIWQLRVTDLLALTAVVAAGVAYGMHFKREFDREVAACIKVGIPIDETGRRYTVMCGTGIPLHERSRGGPSWLRELWGEEFPPWFDRLVFVQTLENGEWLRDLRGLEVLHLSVLNLEETIDLDVLSELPRLRAVSIECAFIQPAETDAEQERMGRALEAWIAALNACPRLEWLGIEAYCGDEWMTALCLLPRLRGVILRHSLVTDEGLRHLVRLPRVEHLDLGRTMISDEGMQHVAKVKRLKSLAIDATRITADGLAQLAELTELKVLSFRDAAVDAAALEKIATIESLEEVDLEFCTIRPTNFECLASLSRLRELHLPSSADRPSVVRLCKAMPNLEVTFEEDNSDELRALLEKAREGNSTPVKNPFEPAASDSQLKDDPFGDPPIDQ